MASVGALISGVAGAVSSSAVATFAVRTAVGFGLSALSRALSDDPSQAQRQRGIRTKATTSGATQPQSLIFGRTATGGNAISPSMAFGEPDDDPQEYLTYAIDLADFPITDVESVLVDGQEWQFDTAGDENVQGLLGDTPSDGSLSRHMWMRWHDGTQTQADSTLVTLYGDYPERPWSSSMTLKGVAYAVMTFKYRREKWSGFPKCRFVVKGAPLYDPREDDTAGGSGSQRWDDQSTWAFTQNPVVMIYNVLRGIELADGQVYGYNCDLDDLPISDWVAAMNVCDEQVELKNGNTQPRYRAGLEVPVNQEPRETVEELKKACGGEVAEFGGRWTITVGPPPPPILHITDDDILRTSDAEMDPFPGLQQTFTGVTATGPDPSQNWESVESVPIHREDLEEAAGGRRLVADMSLPAVWDGRQRRRQAREALADHQRMRSHAFTLPPEAIMIPPLSTISWTSKRNYYKTKLFEITTRDIDAETLNVPVQIRERDPGDYDPDGLSDDVLPNAPTAAPVAGAVPPLQQWFVEAIAIPDNAGNARRSAIRMAWSPDLPDYEAIRWVIRLADTGERVARGSTADVDGGEMIVSSGILPDTAYEVRARAVSRRETVWTQWTSVTTDNIKLGLADVAENEFQDLIEASAASRTELANARETLRGEFQDADNDLLADINSVSDDLDGFQATVEQTYVTQGNLAGLVTSLTSSAGGRVSWLPQNAETTRGFFTFDQEGNPDQVATPNLNGPGWRALSDGRLSNNDIANSAALRSQGVIPVGDGESVQARLSARATGSSSGGDDGFRFRFDWLDESFEHVSSDFATRSLRPNGSITDVTGKSQSPVSGYCRVGLLFNDSDYGAPSNVNVYFFSFSAENTIAADSATAEITQELYTKTETDEAIATGIDTYDAQLPGGLQSTVGQNSTALANVNSALAEQILFAETSGGGIAELRLASIDDRANGNSGSIVEIESDLTVFRNQQLQSGNYSPGNRGWRIRRNGNFEVNTLDARGSMQSPDFNPDNEGWRIGSNGGAEFSRLQVNGVIQGRDFIVTNSAQDFSFTKYAATNYAQRDYAEISLSGIRGGIPIMISVGLVYNVDVTNEDWRIRFGGDLVLRENASPTFNDMEKYYSIVVPSYGSYAYANVSPSGGNQTDYFTITHFSMTAMVK